MLRYIFVLAFIIFLFSCNTTKPVQTPELNSDTTSCQFEASLLDYTANTNCQFLFKLADGTKLLPSSMPQVDFPFFDGKKVIIGYKIYNNTRTKSECGIEDKIVEITCMEEIQETFKGPTTHEECESVKNVFINLWMPDMIASIKPQKIFEYEYSIGYLYLFKKDDTSIIYDCLGNKLCDTNDGGDCKSLIESLGKATLIQVLNN